MNYCSMRCCLLILTGLSVQALTTVRFMSNHCNTKHDIFVNNSIVLKLTNQLLTDDPGDQIHCTADLATDTGSRLLIHFLSLSISIENDMPDSLHIYDVDGDGHAQMVTPVSGLFGIYDKFFKRASMGVGDYISTSNRFRLTYVGSPSLFYRGFEILVTSLKDVHRDGTCPRRFGKCGGKQVCVPYSVWCDGKENCGEGDHSDEETCDQIVTDDWKYTYAITMAVVTAVVAIALFLSTIGVVVCLLRKYNRRNYLRSMSIAVAAKKDGDNWKITNDLGLTLAMAPPLYDDIVQPNQDEPPPSYDTLRFKQTNDVTSADQNAANECIVVACIENLNPSRGHVDDVLCRENANSADSSEEEDVESREAKALNCASSLNNAMSSRSLHDSSSSFKSSSNLCLEMEEVRDDTCNSRRKEIDNESSSANDINYCEEEMCSSKSSSQCSVETGFVSMGTNSSRNSGDEDSPHHTVGAKQTPREEGNEPRHHQESLRVQYKYPPSPGSDDIKFIDELNEGSNSVN